MKKKSILFLAASVLLAGISSCKKDNSDDDGDDDCEITVASVAGVYKLVSSVDITMSGSPVDMLHVSYDDCELDDTNELKADGTFVYTDAGVVCSPSGSTSGTWSISGTTLVLNSGFSNIESYNCKDLVVTFRDENDRLIRETYKRQ